MADIKYWEVRDSINRRIEILKRKRAGLNATSDEYYEYSIRIDELNSLLNEFRNLYYSRHLEDYYDAS